LRLKELVPLLEGRLQRFNPEKEKTPAPKMWKSLADRWNTVLWRYVEFLEGAIEELFVEASRIDLQVWSTEIMEVFLAVKGVLESSLNEIEEVMSGLNRALVGLRERTDPKTWSVKRLFESSILDEDLFKSVRQSRISLQNGSEKVITLYDNLNEMKEDVIASAVKIGTLPVFSNLDSETQQNFLELYELLKCFEKNRKLPLLEEKDLLMSLRKTTSKEQAFTIFRDYYHALHRELFHQSFDVKRNAAAYASREMIVERVAQLKEIEGEVSVLASTIDHYREFLLATDPNPYVRARLGFSEWVLGPESQETKHLYKFGYSLESLHRLYGQLIDSVQKGPRAGAEESADKEIDKVLHEMGAPLLSEKVMVKHAEDLITRFEEINELGSYDFSLIEKMGGWLGRALRFDWKHHVLQRYPEFHEIYAIHMGLAGAIDDQLHVNRLKKFKRLLAELREWISQKETAKHTRDIDLDINDIRGYLQEFLAHVQRSLGVEGESTVTRERMEKMFSRQLLEYRHLFGYFFHQFNNDNIDESLIRSKCYFVDQYFEAVDKKLSSKNMTSKPLT
jgi:hypothetical protein